MKNMIRKLPLAALVSASFFAGNAAFATLVAAPQRMVFPDDAWFQGNAETFENLSGENGGAFCAFDDLTISGGITFKNNSATKFGGAIWVKDDLTFVNSGNGTMTFTGNTAAGTPNDVFLAGNDDKLIFVSGTYTLDGGLDTSRGSDVFFRSGVNVTFAQNAKNIIGGRAHFAFGSQVAFGENTTSEFRGGLELAADQDQTLLGNVTVGRDVRLNFDAAAYTYATLDLSRAKSVTINPGTRIVLPGLYTAYWFSSLAGSSEKTLIYGKGDQMKNFVVGESVADAPFWTAKTQLSGNNITLLTTKKSAAQAAADIGGNAAAALVFESETRLDTPTYAEARRTAGLITGELAASFAHAQVARARISAGQVSRFLTNEISGKFNVRENAKTAFASPFDRRVFQAATPDGSAPGIAAGTPAKNLEELGWEIALAYLGQQGEVDENGGYNAYDYDYDGAWLGIKKAFSFGVLGASLECGNGESAGSDSRIEADAWGAGAFVFVPVTNAGTYFLAQSGFSLGENTLHRRRSRAEYKGDFDSLLWFVQAEAGTHFEIAENLKLNPYAAFAYTYYNAENFSDGENTYGKTNFSDANFKPGVRVRSDFEIAEIKVWASLGIAWTHRFSDDAADLRVKRGNVAATVRGNAGSQDFAEASADFGFSPTESLKISAGYAYTTGGDLEEHGIYARVGWEF